MSTIRNGKIARLPEAIREQVNRRMAGHESSTPLLAWLNAMPEVREVMAREFGGRAIDKYNVHEWRKGGFAEWRRQQEARKMMERLCAGGHVLAEMGSGAVMDTMAGYVAARYVISVKQLAGQGGDQAGDWNRLRDCCQDLVALQRREYLAQRLELQREKVQAGLVGAMLASEAGAPMPSVPAGAVPGAPAAE